MKDFEPKNTMGLLKFSEPYLMTDTQKKDIGIEIQKTNEFGKWETMELINSFPTKCYIGKMSQQRFSATIKAIKYGRISVNKQKDFFAKFGYTQNEVTWKKK